MPDELVVDTSVIAAMLLREPGWQAISTRLASLDTVRTAPFFRFECANVVGKQRADAAAIDLVWALPVDDRFDVADAQEAYPLAGPHLHGNAQACEEDADAGLVPSRARRQARGVSSWTRFTGWRPSRPRTSTM